MANVIGRGIKKGLQGMGGDNTRLGEVYIEDGSKRCLQSTFAPYYIVAIALNSVAVLAGVVSQYDFHYNQRNTHFDRIDTWYTANAVFGVLHILAAIYIVYKIEKPNNVHSKTLNDSENPTAFDYNKLQGAVDTPPPPQNPSYIQAHEVVVLPMDRTQRAPSSFPHVPPRVPPKVLTEPSTWPRIKYVLTEDKIVAIYILIFALYLSWHYFMDFSHINYRYNHGILFVMHCADIFVWTGPASLLFSIGYTMAKRD